MPPSMDITQTIQQFGFAAFAAIMIAWYLKSQLDDRIRALEQLCVRQEATVNSLNEYIREELATLLKQAHNREASWVQNQRRNYKPTNARGQEEETQELLAVVHAGSGKKE
jgi:uncharacterized coiled-coil protein SlyX